MGLCVFANAAVAVKMAMSEHRLNKVVIVDWDAHHGNGTESAFYHDPSVLTISIHQDLLIADRGFIEHRGELAGEGYNINIPLPPGSGTGAYLAAFDRVVLPAIRKFGPDLILVASGLDACIADPTARMMMNSEGYRQLTEKMMQVADEVCHGRLVLTQEGGYEPTMVPFCALAVFEQLSGIRTSVVDPFMGVPKGEAPTDHQALQPHQEVVIGKAENLLAGL
jgi:acetoin utilization deacetylase AcuC-like enzyme